MTSTTTHTQKKRGSRLARYAILVLGLLLACNPKESSRVGSGRTQASSNRIDEVNETHYLLTGRNVIVKRFPTGLFRSNSYIVRVNNVGFIVDAGAKDEEIFQYIARNGVAIRQIFITHSHVDHLGYGTLLKERTGGKLYMHEADLQHFKYYTPERIQSLMVEGQLKQGDLPTLQRFLETKLDAPLHGGEHFDLQGLDIEVLHTPGHSAGSICVLVAKSLLFSGDTLFPRAFGRTDLDTGDRTQIYRSLRLLLTAMPNEVVLLPGHGDVSTMGEAKAYVGKMVL